MDRKLGDFISILRRNGLRISPPEAGDAGQAVGLIGYGSRDAFREALASTLVKGWQDRPVFDRCFDDFFTTSRDHPLPSSEAPPQTTPAAGQGQARGSGGGQGGGERMDGVPPSALAELLLADSEAGLDLALARAAAEVRPEDIRVVTQKGLFGRRLLMAMGLEALERELDALRAVATPATEHRALRLRTALERLRRRVRETVARHFELVKHRDQDAVLRSTQLALLRDSAEVGAVVRRMARKLVMQHRRREKLAARGRLDVRATLRRNLAHDGVLAEPRWRRIRKDRPRVMAVCDVSRSVSQHARFLLLFLYSLQEVIPRLRTFVFANRLHEVTPLFDAMPVTEALDEVMERHGLGSTDYGRALTDLDDLAGGDIDHRTTLIMLGDGRNNGGEPRLDLMRRFHGRARQVIWLNPEERNRWGSGDSEMLRYATCCTRSHSCRTLDELERIVDRLLKAG